jgi:transcriptional regulator with XRE-family HTH domain
MAKKKKNSGRKKLDIVSRSGLQSESWTINFPEIKRRREKLGLTMAEAAGAAGMHHRQDWYRIESGTRRSLSLNSLVRISRVLRCKVDALLTFTA